MMKPKFKKRDFSGPSNVGWVKRISDGKKVLIQPSPKFKNEPWSAQVVRAQSGIPNNVDVWNDVLMMGNWQPVMRKGSIVGFTNIESKQSFLSQPVFKLSDVAVVGSWVTKVSDDKEIVTAKVTKIKDDGISVEVYSDNQFVGKKKWPLIRLVVKGKHSRLTVDEKRVAELKELHSLYGYTPSNPTEQDVADYASFGVHLLSKSTKSDDPEKSTKKEKQAKGKDKYGFRLGSRAAAINAALTTKYQSMKKIMKTIGWTTPIHGHLNHLVKIKIAKVKEFNGVKKWRLRKDLGKKF